MKTCWTCGHNKLGSLNMFGICQYFLLLNQQPKDITPAVADRGCKYWKEKGKKVKEC